MVTREEGLQGSYRVASEYNINIYKDQPLTVKIAPSGKNNILGELSFQLTN